MLYSLTPLSLLPYYFFIFSPLLSFPSFPFPFLSLLAKHLSSLPFPFLSFHFSRNISPHFSLFFYQHFYSHTTFSLFPSIKSSVTCSLPPHTLLFLDLLIPAYFYFFTSLQFFSLALLSRYLIPSLSPFPLLSFLLILFCSLLFSPLLTSPHLTQPHITSPNLTSHHIVSPLFSLPFSFSFSFFLFRFTRKYYCQAHHSRISAPQIWFLERILELSSP